MAIIKIPSGAKTSGVGGSAIKIPVGYSQNATASIAPAKPAGAAGGWGKAIEEMGVGLLRTVFQQVENVARTEVTPVTTPAGLFSHAALGLVKTATHVNLFPHAGMLAQSLPKEGVSMGPIYKAGFDLAGYFNTSVAPQIRRPEGGFAIEKSDTKLIKPIVPFGSVQEAAGSWGEAAINATMLMGGPADIIGGPAVVVKEAAMEAAGNFFKAKGISITEQGAKAIVESAIKKTGQKVSEKTAADITKMVMFKGFTKGASKFAIPITRTGLEIAGKHILLDAMSGAAFGVATEAQNKDATAGDYAKAAGEYAAGFAAVPLAMHGVGSFMGLARNAVGRVAGPALDKLELGLKNIAKREGLDVNAERIVNNAADRPLKPLEAPKSTLMEKAAGTLLKTIGYAKEAPANFMEAWIDPNYRLHQMQLMSDAITGKAFAKTGERTIAEKFLAETATAEHRHSKLTIDLFSNIKALLPSEDTTSIGKAIEFAQLIDQLVRQKSGLATDKVSFPDGDIIRRILKFKADESADFQTINRIAQEIQKYFHQNLKDVFFDDPEGLARIVSKHPYYFPLRTIDSAEGPYAELWKFAEETMGEKPASTRNAGSLALKKAGGTESETQIANLFSVTEYGLMMQKNAAKRRNMVEFMDLMRPVAEQAGFTPVFTHEMDMSRQADIQRLARLSEQARTTESSIGTARKGLAKNLSERRNLEGRAVETRDFASALRTTVERAQERLSAKEDTAIGRAAVKDAKVEVLAKRAKELEVLAEDAGKATDAKALATQVSKMEKKLQETEDALRVASEGKNVAEKAVYKLDEMDAKLKELKASAEDARIKLSAKSELEKVSSEANTLIDSSNELLNEVDRQAHETQMVISYPQKKLTAILQRASDQADKLGLTYKTEAEYRKAISAYRDTLDMLKEQKKEIRDNMEAANVATDARKLAPDAKEITPLVKGTKERWIVPKEIAAILNNADVGLVKWTKGWLSKTPIGKLATGLANVQAVIDVRANPIFMVWRNMAKDSQGSGAFAGANAFDMATALFEQMKGSKATKDEMAVLAEDHLLYMEMLQGRGQTPDQATAKLLSRFDLFSPEMNKDMGVKKQSFLQRLSEAEERAPRYADFRKGMTDRGMSPAEAVRFADSNHVNFRKSGKYAEQINRVVPFFNAQVQGMYNFLDKAVKNPYEFYSRMLWTTAPPVALLNAHNSQFASYDNIPFDERIRNWVWIVDEYQGQTPDGKRTMIPIYAKFPVGEALAVTKGALEFSLMSQKRRDEIGYRRLMGSMLDAMSPITTNKIPLPTALRIPLELGWNYSSFKKGPIVAQWVYHDGKWWDSTKVENWQKYSDSTTTETAKLLGHALNWSPAKIDYVLKQGSIGELVRALDLPILIQKNGGDISKVAEQEAKDAKFTQLPFVRDFIGSSNIGDYYVNKENALVEEKAANTKKLEKIRAREEARQKRTP